MSKAAGGGVSISPSLSVKSTTEFKQIQKLYADGAREFVASLDAAAAGAGGGETKAANNKKKSKKSSDSVGPIRTERERAHIKHTLNHLGKAIFTKV